MFEHLSYAVVGGFFPALLWLLFWMQEDRKHPEPIRLLALTFFLGMVAVLPALKFESLVYLNINNETTRLVLWSVIEELSKFLVVCVLLFKSKELDEPIDFVVYMITVALGFAALENTLFLLGPISKGQMSQSLLTGNLRFVGATLLHIASSASVGIAMALAFYKKRVFKYLYLVSGLILAIALHSAFNLTIIESVTGKGNAFVASVVVWLAVVVIILLLEKVKKVHPV